MILVLLMSACGSTGSGPTTSNGKVQLKIMVGGLSKQIYLPNMLTQRLGYFSQEGLDVTLIDEASGQSSEDEVLAGQVDAGWVVQPYHRAAGGRQANGVGGPIERRAR
jgi:NitT/TauT family transport system substrate-binding protein